MKQADIYGEAEVNGTNYQWLAFADGDMARIDMYQETDNGWLRYRGLQERLHGGTVKALLEETISTWLSYSAENGHEVRRTA